MTNESACLLREIPQPLRLAVPLDAAAAALDARRLQRFANTGDCAARVKRNPAVDQ